jgi:hypothetical protein
VAVRLRPSAVKSEGPGPARTARGFAWLSVARGAGLWVFWVYFYVNGLGGVTMPSFENLNR